MLTATRQKMLRDLSQEGTRSVLVVFAIAVGLAGFTSVLSAYAILTRELNNGYLATNPASATLRMDPIDDALLSAVELNPAIREADARRIVMGQIKRAGGPWSNLKLFVVKDFAGIRISKLQPEKGAWPPATGEILIERDAFQVARVSIGDTVTAKTSAGREKALRISGSVHDVGQAQARMENLVYGYITLDTLAQLGEEPYLDRLNILVANDPFNESHIRTVAAEIKKIAESRGHTVHRVDVPPPGEHPHAHIMGLLLISMSSFGFCILGLSGILVVNLLTSIMAAQVRQIGVMKAIGGTGAQISWIYFSQALLLGAMALVIAIPLGIAGGRALCRAMAVFLNFDITTFATPLWVYLLASAAGLLVPLLSAAFPVWNGTRVSVRSALCDFGVSSDAFGTGAFDRVLARIGGISRPVLFALRNSFRRRTRLALTLATLGAGGLFFLCALNVRSSLVHTLDRFYASRKFDLSVHLTGMQPLEKVQLAARNTAGVVRAEGWVVTDASLSGVEHFPLVALPAKSEFLKLDLAEGRDLLPGETDAIVINTALADTSTHPALGQTIDVRTGSSQSSLQSTLRVVGITREQFSPPTGYVVLRGDRVNDIRLVLKRTDRALMDQIKTALDANLARNEIRSQGSASTSESRYSFDQHMLMIYVFLVVVSLIIAAIGGLGLMTSLSLNVMERRREMGVLRAIGATPSAVWLMVIAEGVTVGVLSWALAGIAAWPLSKVLGNLLINAFFKGGLDFRFELSGLLIWLTISVFLGVAASLLPAWTASRATVREALM